MPHSPPHFARCFAWYFPFIFEIFPPSRPYADILRVNLHFFSDNFCVIHLETQQEIRYNKTVHHLEGD